MTLESGVLARLWDHVALDDIDLPADLAERRRAATAEAVARAEPLPPDGRCAVGLRRYVPGCIALALRGCFEQCSRRFLRDLAEELPRVAVRELVVDLSGLDRCDPALARALARLRIRCLTRTARVELRDLPPALAAELGRSSP